MNEEENNEGQSWTGEEVSEYANPGDFGLSYDELDDLIDAMCGY